MADVIQQHSLRNQFLIAMPHMEDPNFAHTVTYICEHSEEGAMGIVINLISNLSMSDIFDELKIASAGTPPTILEQPIMQGGPVQPERGFILHSKTEQQWLASTPITDSLSLTCSPDILEAIAAGEGPEHWQVALGYAGWGAGQLEQEIAENTWLNCPASEHILFNTPVEQRANAAAAVLGIDLNLISSQAGHA